MLDIVSLGLIGGSSYAVTQLFVIKPLNKSVPKEGNTLMFCLIPIAVYILYRVYFSASFFITSKIIPRKVRYLDSYVNFLFIVSGLAASVMFPQVRAAFATIHDTYFNDILGVIYEQSLPEIEKTYKFGLRLLSLLVGWFLLLFTGELILRIIIAMVGLAVRMVWPTIGPTSTRNYNKVAGERQEDVNK